MYSNAMVVDSVKGGTVCVRENQKSDKLVELKPGYFVDATKIQPNDIVVTRGLRNEIAYVWRLGRVPTKKDLTEINKEMSKKKY